MRTQILNFSFEVKSLQTRQFEGHAAVFKNVDLGGDIIIPGAFSETLTKHKAAGALPQMFWMHQPDQVPGKWLEMNEDTTGLYVKGVLAETQLGEEMHTLLGMKAVRGMSIGYSLPRKYDGNGRRLDVDWDDDGHRILKQIDLWEASLVSLAMNPLAQVERSKSRLSRDGEYVPTVREVERSLRDVGYTKSAARIIASRFLDDDGPGGMLDGHRRDAGTVDDEAAVEVLKLIERTNALMLEGTFRK